MEIPTADNLFLKHFSDRRLILEQKERLLELQQARPNNPDECKKSTCNLAVHS